MMTLYSYLISWIRNKNFKEPVLLDKMAGRLLPVLNTKNRLAGWAIHFAVGLLFAETFAQFWKPGQNFANVKRGLVVGGLSGIAAILLWKFTLEAHPLPPAVDFVRFAGQLFIAHVVFGLFGALGYNAV